jgi:hypothetical protein
MATATFAVWDALVAAIKAENPGPVDADSDPLLNAARVYRGRVPPGVSPALSYFLLGQRSEGEGGFVNQPGQSGAYRIHCWSDTPDNAGRLFAWLKDLVHDARLSVTGHDFWIGGQLRFVSELAGPTEQDGTESWQVVADYVVETLEG